LNVALLGDRGLLDGNHLGLSSALLSGAAAAGKERGCTSP
jgi:hypothetical protein